MRIIENQTFQPVLDALTKSNKKPFLVGPNGSSLAFTISLLVHNISRINSSKTQLLPRSHLPQSWVILTPTHGEAEQIYQDLLFFYSLLGLPTETVAFFPNRGTAPYEATTPSVDLVAQRMRTLFRLHEQQPTVVITTPGAALQRLVPITTFANSCLSLKIGSVIDRKNLITHFLRIGYRRVSVVEIPGEFSVRGGIVDIFSTAESEPYRIEFLGDTVESARCFDPGSQESTKNIINAHILPAREYIIPLNQTDLDLSSLTPDAEWQSPNLYETMNTLLEYFTEQPLILMDRPLNLAHEAQKIWEGLLQTWEQLEQAHTSLPYPEPDTHFLIWEEFQAQMAPSPIMATDVVPATEEDWLQFTPLSFQSPKSIGLGLRGTPFTETLKILEQKRMQGPVTIVVRSASQVGRLLALFAEHQAPAIEGKPSLHSTSSDHEPFYIQQGYLSSGVFIQNSSFTVVTEDELFAKISRHRPQPKSKTAAFLSSLEDLNAGDFVVHVQHGISQYLGLRHLAVQGFESDYLILEFAGKDTLYVPLDRINQVQKYRGGEHIAPRLDRLGGTSWAKTKSRVKKGIEDMTNELVELYASREVTTRRSYSEDMTLAHEFEAAFDYEETPDQIKAIEDIQRDLELSKPMDRLVCGDVGYGKTEVAMRAALKAVQDNRQVAVLVPTTLLAQQHFETFCQRFEPFPVKIGILSRFQSPKQVKKLLPDLASGVVDIIIGTHRVLQKTVQFKNLGLVIIDEEQWFGVRHKERMKQLRTQVDVLTLTATPIPRTLQMAFSGVRDLSVIETPPQGRLAIRTQVLRFNANVIREAIRRELARGGQVFYVHNRVQSIERTTSWLQELVPEARILMAHGQMNGYVLEGVMLKFFHGDADILVASAIIQSGLDIPRANTILVDRADIFGLAQLYQLRGRVGRAGDQAYAYFFFSNEEVLSTDAQKRLMAIQEFAELGSGFRIAAADLEIRGAGNLLGKQQSGNMAAVGLDLYMQMVERAVQQMKGKEVDEEIDPTLHLNVSAFIPDDYVEDTQQRLSLYKRLSASQKIGDLALLHEETQDRYGSLPEAVERLFEVMQIRLLAKKLRLESLEASKGKIILTQDSRATIPQESFDWLMQYTGENLKFLSPLSVAIDTEQEEWAGLIRELNTILTGLLDTSIETVQV